MNRVSHTRMAEQQSHDRSAGIGAAVSIYQDGDLPVHGSRDLKAGDATS
jgi:hypothetical protein